MGGVKNCFAIAHLLLNKGVIHGLEFCCLFVCFAVCSALPELFALQNAKYAKYLRNAKYVTVSLTLCHRTQRFSNMRDIADAICVLYIAEQIEFGRYVQPMCLPDDETVFSEGSRCFIAGWGETFSNDQESSLHELDMPLLR